MSQTKLLWELENHNKLLDKYIKKLKIFKDDPDLRRIILRHKQLEEELSNHKDKDIKIKQRLKEKEKTLKNYIFNMDELDKKLYNNQMTDFKQLDYLIQEKEKFKQAISDLEVEIINLLDDTEFIEKEINQLADELDKINKKVVEYEKRKSVNIDKINAIIKEEENKIIDLIQVIEPNIMDKYNLIKGTKNSAVAQILNGICSGCNMVIPAYIVDEVNSKRDLVKCENCGRILFVNK
ncbi:C4-type zinc ribbon domain-containing protein [Tissierella sp. Yu-01]|uniref:zinc ribbon domain-containing protein n=1 Tax=Tissierella sp. Yu-01 TaxID=3035694 RepID=UPI00240E601C|nr:C4-type zinc ribbon domain-containing protein [Tissierella sp. Yu-01]WFA09566.1 C4-type zinc ribbon domain-containing protein [Tissierella sp. Yu-01]